MVKSSDIARGYQAVEQDRIRKLVRRHEAQQNRLRENQPIPGAGFLGFLAGWWFMKLLDEDRKR
jgi:hypothetical protein